MSNPSLRARRASVLAAVVITVLGAALAPAAGAATTAQVATTYYDVVGATQDEIRTSLDERNPGEYDAQTTWNVTWSYASRMSGGRCRAVTWKVHTKIIYLYPRWTAPETAPVELRDAWATYMSRLQVHEAGHAYLGRATAKRVAATIRTKTAASCSTLDIALRRTMLLHFAAGRAANRAYDARTGHGATQGALFPAPAAAPTEAA